MTKRENNVFATFIHTCKAKKSYGMPTDPKFKKDILSFIRTKGINNFYKHFGTHYIAEIFNYASFFGQLEFKVESEEEKKRIAYFLQRKSFQGKNQDQYDLKKKAKQDTKVEERRNISSKIQTLGVPMRTSVSSPEDLVCEYNSYLSKIEKNPVELSPCVVVLKPYSSLFEFISCTDSNLFQKIQKEIEEEQLNNIKTKIIVKFMAFLEEKQFKAISYLLKIKDLGDQFEKILRQYQFTASQKSLMFQYMEAFEVLKDTSIWQLFEPDNIGIKKDLCFVLNQKILFVESSIEQYLFNFQPCLGKLQSFQNGKFYHIILRNLKPGEFKLKQAFAISSSSNKNKPNLVLEELNLQSEDQLFEFIPAKDNKFQIRHKKLEMYLDCRSLMDPLFAEPIISNKTKNHWYQA